MTKEVLKLALETLIKCKSALAEELAAWDMEPPLHHVLEASNACDPAISAIREVLAQTVSSHGNAEDLYVEMSKHLNCPHCGGSGHIDDVAQPEQEPVTVLPDGSAFAVMSYPLPKDHWLYQERQYNNGEYEPVELGKPILTHEMRDAVVSAVRYAIRGATNCGKEVDFDPDALVQNAVYALCGPYTTPPQTDEFKCPLCYDDIANIKNPSQPEQEPVTWGVDWGKAGDIPCVSIIKRLPDGGIQVLAVEYAPYSYTTPPQRKPLTDEEIDAVTDSQWAKGVNKPIYAAHRAYARAIEAKLKQKNGHAEENT